RPRIADGDRRWPFLPERLRRLHRFLAWGRFPIAGSFRRSAASLVSRHSRQRHDRGNPRGSCHDDDPELVGSAPTPPQLPGKRGADRLSIAFQQNEGQVRLEFFIGAQTSENILGELSTLQPQPQDLSGEDAGLRILRGLVQSLDHQQYYEGEYLSFSVDSRPLT